MKQITQLFLEGENPNLRNGPAVSLDRWRTEVNYYLEHLT